MGGPRQIGMTPVEWTCDACGEPGQGEVLDGFLMLPGGWLYRPEGQGRLALVACGWECARGLADVPWKKQPTENELRKELQEVALHAVQKLLQEKGADWPVSEQTKEDLALIWREQLTAFAVRRGLRLERR